MLGIDTNKIYQGTILPYQDKLNPTKYAVHIPDIHYSPTGKMELKYIWADNEYTNNYQCLKKQNGDYMEFGDYIPLEPELTVLVKFRTQHLDSAYIINVASEHKKIPEYVDKDNFYLLCSTKNQSKIYIDDTKNRIHLSQHNGKTDIMLDDYGITLQINDTSTSKTVMQSKMELSENGFLIQFGENKLTFNETGFGITYGENRTFFKMTKKGIELVGEEFLNITSTGPLNIYGETTNITGEGSLNLRGTNTKLTGLQKLAMNGNIIHMEGIMDTHIKSGLSLNIESLLHLSVSAVISDQQYTGMSNIFTAMENKVTSISVETSSMKAEAISTMVKDGMTMSGMGIAASIGSSVSSSVSATMIGLKASMLGLTTTFNMDNIGMAVASAVLADNTIADTAEPASNITDNLFGTLPLDDDGTNFITKLTDSQRNSITISSKYVTPSSLLMNYGSNNQNNQNN